MNGFSIHFFLKSSSKCYTRINTSRELRMSAWTWDLDLLAYGGGGTWGKCQGKCLVSLLFHFMNIHAGRCMECPEIRDPLFVLGLGGLNNWTLIRAAEKFPLRADVFHRFHFFFVGPLSGVPTSRKHKLRKVCFLIVFFFL